MTNPNTIYVIENALTGNHNVGGTNNKRNIRAYRTEGQAQGAMKTMHKYTTAPLTITTYQKAQQ